jgi:Protein of unknown function (DUF559)
MPVELTEGPFSLEQARRYGLSKHHLLGASWRRLGRGLYAWRDIADQPHVMLAAAALRLPKDAIFSGPSAAWLHGLDVSPCDPIEVTLPSTSGISRRAGLTLRRCDVPAGEVVLRRGFRTTSPVRTVADLGRRLATVEAVVLLDMAMHVRLVNAEQLRQWADGHRGLKGVARLSRAIELAEPAAESVMETRLRLLLVFGGLPKPLSQVAIYDDAGFFLGRLDLFYPDKRLAVEYDGATHRDSLTSDNRRQNRLIDSGYRILRFTASDVFNSPTSVVALVRRAIRYMPR